MDSNKIAKELVLIAKELARIPKKTASFENNKTAKVWEERKKEILERANEHEMNVDAGDELPVKKFKVMLKLLKKAPRLTEDEWDELQEIVDGMEWRS